MKKILPLLMVVVMVLWGGIVTASAEDAVPATGEYEEPILSKLGVSISEDGELSGGYEYAELYTHFDYEDALIPQYVLVYANSVYRVDYYFEKHIGDYVMSGSTSDVGTFGYHVYIPDSDVLYCFEEAYNSDIPDIDIALEYFFEGDISLNGDADSDGSLTVKDATQIQKMVAGVSFDAPRYVMDFDCDDDVNVKDATAIQKCVAGLAY